MKLILLFFLKNLLFNILISCFLITCNTSFSQENDEEAKKNIISGVVYDSLNHEPLGLVKVYNLTNKSGTSTTFQGNYRLENVTLTDSISFYLIGFEKRKIIVNDLIQLDTLFLNLESQIIDEVIILADNSILFDLISKCKNIQTKNDIVSKTYIEVKSTNNSETVELIQGYYNGYFNGYKLSKLVTKNIRLGLRPVNQRIYTSVRTTGVFYENDLFNSTSLFPLNPLQLNKQKLKKNYHLLLHGKFKENDKTIYVIGFESKNENSDFFNGIIWIDSINSKVYKIILEKNNVTQHPFAPFWNSKKLSNVNLKITKSFSYENNSIKTNFVDFEYSLDYQAEDTGSLINIKTHATLQPYNYYDSFIEPIFNFPDEKEWPNHELSKLAVIEYDTLFWKCQEEYKTSSNDYDNNLFYNDSLTITGQMLYDQGLFQFASSENSNYLKNLFVNWNKEKRIFLKDLGVDTSIYSNTQGVIPSQLYHLEAQIYLNINKVCDSVYYSTKTIYDPFKTFYHYPFTSETLVFINVYFDLIEIQRQKLDTELKLCNNDIDLMKSKYVQIMQETEILSKKYFNEVNRGYNQTGMISWNKFVKERLNIDNIELFTEKK